MAAPNSFNELFPPTDRKTQVFSTFFMFISTNQHHDRSCHLGLLHCKKQNVFRKTDGPCGPALSPPSPVPMVLGDLPAGAVRSSLHETPAHVKCKQIINPINVFSGFTVTQP